MTDDEDVELYIAPCSREHKEHTYRYFRETVLNPVSPDHFEPLREAGFETPTSIWGVVSGNRTHWESIDQGDALVFYTKSGMYTHAAVVTHTEKNQELAEELWEPYDGGRIVADKEEPWSFMIYLDRVRRIDLPAEELHEALGYSMEYPQGFMRPTDERFETLRAKHGSVRSFLDSYIPPTSPGLFETV
ncbi:hypothetical protein [Natronorubrum aibiense]|uniref:EVE domain-containing protein n=1 Tax=Natronorubrum aibiense TaxID=348826 RepID=A0A5P9P838_9EURY|nr:hypothetical protein [Natronorubrum aibiense]QFU84276.1 hypothetical protein GCU68_16990 [Natronorubrum aibiense]